MAENTGLYKDRLGFIRICKIFTTRLTIIIKVFMIDVRYANFAICLVKLQVEYEHLNQNQHHDANQKRKIKERLW